jgi:hypothetical protein
MNKKRSGEDFWKELRPLMERYNQMGRQLPKFDEFTAADVPAATVLLAEMDRVKAEIDALLEAARRQKG